MNIQKSLARVDAQIEQLKQQRAALVLLFEKLEGLDEPLNVTVYGEYIDFNRPSRAQAVKIMTHLKSGKWDKEPTEDAKINYVNNTFLPGTKLRMWSADPPPSCKLVEVEEEIPAQPARVVKRMKLVCKEHELQAV